MAEIKKIIDIKTLAELDGAADEFIKFISESDLQSNIFAFYGSMGAGKTTFIKAICKALGVKDNVNSPTFTIINEYASAKGFPIYHFDFYRINKTAEALDIGFYDYIDSGCLCIMEWPENIEEILPDDTLKVHIEVQPDESRLVFWDD